MTPLPKPILDLARQMLALEAVLVDSNGFGSIVAMRVCLKLKPPLTALMGSTGFASILGRALTLAKSDVPALAAATVQPDGALQGFEGNDSDQFILVGHLLALLATFIGESLTRRIVSEVWPEVAAPKGEGQS